ncbi:MAG: hypothetical protein IJI07_02165 [Flexilinea sp.]|nr:hypothetical protein [Flexilinea sp.]
MEITEVFEPDFTGPYDGIESTWTDPEDGTLTIDPFGLPFESMDEYSDAPLEFEELAGTLWDILNDTYLLSVKYNRHSPTYLKLCSRLEKDIRQVGSLCITKAVLEQKDFRFPKLDGLNIKELYAMVSLHFRKCRRAFQDGCDSGRGYDMEMLDWLCRWALLAERLKATEDRIQKIRSGKINADRLLEREVVFRNEPLRKRPHRAPEEIRKAASLPVISSFASEMVRRKRNAERQRIREERRREKADRKAVADMAFPAPKPFPPDTGFRELVRARLLEDAKARGDTEAMQEIPKENSAELGKRWNAYREAAHPEGAAGRRKKPSVPSRTGPSDEVRKKLREKRKKRR